MAIAMPDFRCMIWREVSQVSPIKVTRGREEGGKGDEARQVGETRNIFFAQGTVSLRRESLCRELPKLVWLLDPRLFALTPGGP